MVSYEPISSVAGVYSKYLITEQNLAVYFCEYFIVITRFFLGRRFGPLHITAQVITINEKPWQFTSYKDDCSKIAELKQQIS